MTDTALSTIASQDLAGFLVALRQAAENHDVLEQYDSLYGTKFRESTTLAEIVAGAQGRGLDAEVDAFVAFVRDHVWQRIAPGVREAVCDRAIAAMAA